MKAVKVSVIIPNYNHARFLDERITSVLNQTYQDFELIILDDKSTDNSKEVIEKYRTNPHVSHIVYNDENSGSTFKQWEKGINLAIGDYVWLAESDDSCQSTLLEKAMKQIENNDNISIAFVHSFTFDTKGNITSGIMPIEPPKIWNGDEFIRRKMCKRNTIENASMAVFARDKVQKIDKDYQQFVGAGDYLFWIKMSEMGDVAEISEPLNLCRIHESKVTNRRERDGSNSRARKSIYDYLEGKGYLSKRKKDFVYEENRRLVREVCTNVKAIEKEELIRLWSIDGFSTFINAKIEMLCDIISQDFFKIKHLSFFIREIWLRKVCGKKNNELVKILYGY